MTTTKEITVTTTIKMTTSTPTTMTKVTTMIDSMVGVLESEQRKDDEQDI